MLLFFIHILSLVIATSYSSALSSVLTVPKFEESIDTLHKFVESHIRWGAPSTAWITPLRNADVVRRAAFLTATI